MPAISAPSTTSSPNRSAITSRISSRTIDQRKVVCAVARWPCLMIALSLASPISLGAMASKAAAAQTTRMEIAAPNSPRLVRNSEIPRIGNSSPAAPAASTYRPKSPASMSLSLSMGSNVPSAVVVSASPIGT